MRYFFFGLLSDRDILALVLDRPVDDLPFRPAHLRGYRPHHLKGETFPVLVANPESTVPGVLVEGFSEAERARIAFFESIDYEPGLITVLAESGASEEAYAFLTTGHCEAAPEPWSLAAWRERFKAKDLRETTLWMSLYGHVDAAEADRLWDEARAAGDGFEAMIVQATAPAHRRRS